MRCPKEASTESGKTQQVGSITEPPAVPGVALTNTVPTERTDLGPYTYSPLDPSIGQIRLFTVRINAAGDIFCDIAVVDLDSEPQYLALSYTWGPSAPLHKVAVGNGYVEVRQNLFGFLTTFSKEPEVQHIWIDQISIDQANVSERNHQVAFMARIYSQALYVVVWLGNDSSYKEIALRLQQEWDKRDQQTIGLITSMAENVYFTRLWIVQEYQLARAVKVLVHDNLWIAHDTLSEYFQNYNSWRKIPPAAPWFLAPRPRFSQRDLSFTLASWGSNECEDPRDKVFGLQAIVKPSQRVATDYSRSVSEVYMAAVMTICGEVNSKHLKKVLIRLGVSMGLKTGSSFNMFVKDVVDSQRKPVKNVTDCLAVPSIVVGVESKHLEGVYRRHTPLTKQAPHERWWLEAYGRKKRYYDFRVR